MTLQEKLERLLNEHSAENESNTPDFLLAAYLLGCLKLFGVAVQGRDQWYGRVQDQELPTPQDGN